MKTNNLTVKQIIEELKKAPNQDAVVYAYSEDGDRNTFNFVDIFDSEEEYVDLNLTPFNSDSKAKEIWINIYHDGTTDTFYHSSKQSAIDHAQEFCTLKPIRTITLISNYLEA